MRNKIWRRMYLNLPNKNFLSFFFFFLNSKLIKEKDLDRRREKGGERKREGRVGR